MSVNEGKIDRIVRVLLGLTLIGVAFTGVVSGTLGTVLGFLGFVPLVTGLAGWCPLYSVLGIRTCPTRQG